MKFTSLKLFLRNSNLRNAKITQPIIPTLSFEEQIIKNKIDLGCLLGHRTSICKVRGCTHCTDDYFCDDHKRIAAKGAMVYCLKCKDIISVTSNRQDKIIIYKKDCLKCRSWQPTS